LRSGVLVLSAYATKIGRSLLLAAMMDIVERTLLLQAILKNSGKPAIKITVCSLSRKSRQGENVNSEMLEQVTRREVEAGRMPPHHQLGELARRSP
jgi:hypothetical protein